MQVALKSGVTPKFYTGLKPNESVLHQTSPMLLLAKPLRINFGVKPNALATNSKLTSKFNTKPNSTFGLKPVLDAGITRFVSHDPTLRALQICLLLLLLLRSGVKLRF